MQRPRAVILIVLLLLCGSTYSQQQQQWPKTLLWRISGNGLHKPSYLYGTIHLQDKRLFNFTDSVYQSLESVEGFALEIDFNELVDSIFTRGFKEVEDEMLDEEVEVDQEQIDRSLDSVLRALDLEPGKLTKKDLKKIRDHRMNKMVQQGEMKTIVDGYLYGLALRLGKWTGGIEDVTDQLDLKDELGADLNPEEVFLPEKTLRNSLEQLIRIYINKDLQSIADYVDGKYNKSFKDKLLVQRNIKMARRMDSLTNLRSMFFAVGAAHLPGEEGVIKLLREKGFQVTPVFSAQTISPETYAGKLATVPWQKFENEVFTIEMPGTPQEHQVFGHVMKMQVFFDLPTMTFYMAGHTIGSTKEADIDKAFRQVAEDMGSRDKKIKTKEIKAGKAVGKEGSFNTPNGALKMRMLNKDNTIFFLMAASAKSSNLNSQDVSRFFKSFEAKELNAVTAWKKFSVPGKGISIHLPGIPKANPAIDEKAMGSEWTFKTYDLVDNQSGLYYLLQVRDINAGHYLEGDTSYFSLYKQDIRSRFDRLISEEHFIYKGWPAFRLELALDNSLFHMFNVLRGNRVYCIVVGGSEKASFDDVGKAFNSITLEDYKEPEWVNRSMEGFTAKAPSPFFRHEKDSTDYSNGSIQYSSYDSLTSLSFEVIKGIESPYYWIKDDTSYFNAQLLAYKDYNDSVVKKSIVFNGKLKAIDYILKKDGNNTLRRVRMFVNKDTLYSLVVYMPSQYVNNANVEAFFNDFRLVNEVQPEIYRNKAIQLVEALQNGDSSEFHNALNAFDYVSFSREELPLLHGALIKNYRETNTYYTVNDRISGSLQEIADGSTFTFIENNYKDLAGEKEKIKVNMLEVLAYSRTSGSYQLLKKLLVNDPPREGDITNLNYPLQDSLLLTKTLYPEILKLVNDSLASDMIASVTSKLLDSSYLQANKDMLPYRSSILGQARKKLEDMKQSSETNWWYNSWIDLLGHFNDKEANELLTQVMKLDDLEMKYDALFVLLKNGQTVDRKELEKLAEDISYRKYVYTELKKLGKVSLFPTSYNNQLKLAESEIHNLATDDYEPSKVSFIGERTVEFMGKKQKFFLFKLSFEGEDFSEHYLGITGPYALKGKDIIVDSDASGMYWDEEFELSRLEEQFKTLLGIMESYLKESGKSALEN